MQSDRGQAQVFTLTHQNAQESNIVVSGIIQVHSFEARVLIDPGATHSFVSPTFSIRLD